jgi:quercetin dioxygenase-like cupin family protein
MSVTIVPIPIASRPILASAPGWQETKVPVGAQIAKHFHDFQAYYYAFGIPQMHAGDKAIALPEAAMVIVPPGVVHGWMGPEDQGDAAVGHFHEGHGYHFVESSQDRPILEP